jgi:Tfp pilus assembly protein PilF
MSEEQQTTSKVSPPVEGTATGWHGQSVYLMAITCLILGVAIGYLLRGSQSPTQTAASTTASQQVPAMHGEMGDQPPTLEKMKQMADKAAAPILEKIKSDPKNFEALNEAGKVYRATHQFKEAAGYYERALEVEPKNAAVRTDLASCLYYTGDVDGALTQLDKALTYDPNFFGALLNAGIIKLQAKNDAAGAISSWEKILKTDADPKQKEMVKKLIGDAKRKSEKTDTGEPKA